MSIPPFDQSFLRKDTPHNGFAQGKHTTEFSALLQGLPQERKQLAADLGLPFGTYDNYIRGLQAFPPDLIPRLFAITGDWRIWEFFLEPCGLIAVNRQSVKAKGDDDVFRMLLNIAERLGQAIHEIRAARKDGKLTPHEFARVHFFCSEIERKAREIAEGLRAEVKA